MKKKLLIHAGMPLLAISPLIYLALIWHRVPPSVPLHFNLHLQPDRMGTKAELWIPVGILAGVSLLSFLLLTYLHYIDPKLKGQLPSVAINNIAVGVVMVLAALNFLMVASSLQGAVLYKNFLLPVIGLFVAFLGSQLYGIPPNYVAGWRLPWTMKNELNWKKTHHLAGRICITGGSLLVVTSIILPSKILIPVLIGLISSICFIPVVYSYFLYRSKIK